MLSSSNNGYNSLGAPGSRQCHDSISSNSLASEYQPAPLTTMPQLTPSMSELSFSVELPEDHEPIEQGTFLDSLHGDSGCSPVPTPASEVDLGYKKVDLFLSSEVSACQSSRTVNVLGKTVPLDETEAHCWEESLEEAIPNPSSTSTQEKNTPLLSREQLLRSRESLHSNGYLNDNLCVPHRDEEHLDMLHLPVGVLHDMVPDGNLQASVEVAMECDCNSVFLPDLANSRHNDKGYIHAVMQSGQDGYDYIDCGLKPFPSVTKGTKDLIPCCDGGHVSKEYTFLKEENGNCNIAKCLTMPHSKSDVEINFTFSDNDESLTSVEALEVHPVQTSAPLPTVCSSLPELNNSSGHANSVGVSSSTRNGMPRALHLTTDDYIYT